MDLNFRETVAENLVNTGSIKFLEHTITRENGMVKVEPEVKDYPNPMTLDTFTHFCLEEIGEQVYIDFCDMEIATTILTDENVPYRRVDNSHLIIPKGESEWLRDEIEDFYAYVDEELGGGL